MTGEGRLHRSRMSAGESADDAVVRKVAKGLEADLAPL
jgi:hypothetical protein